MFMSWLRRRFCQRSASRRNHAKRPVRHIARQVESLEDRYMLSAIVWTNKGDDGFGAFGAQATQARAVVQAAINNWSNVIDDFNYGPGSGPPGAGDSFQLTINVGDLANGVLAQGSPQFVDFQGLKPHGGSIHFDTTPHAKDGTAVGWFIDSSPTNHDEFPSGSGFYAVSGGVATDLYTVALHEIGHTLGLTLGGDMAIDTFLVNTGVQYTDPMFGDSRTLVKFDGPPDATFTVGEGGGHLYAGTAFGDLPTHDANDLMNRAIPSNMRRLVSSLDAGILATAYGYTINSTPTFADFEAGASASLNNGVLTVRGSQTHDTITLSRTGLQLNVNLNGVVSQFPVNDIYNRIDVLAGWGDDTVTFNFSGGALAAGVVMNVEGGGGADNFYLTRSAGGTTLSVVDSHIDYGAVDINLKSVGYLEIRSGSGADTITVNNPHRSIGTVNIKTEGSTDTVNVLGLPKTTALVINTGTHDDTVNVGQAGGAIVDTSGLLVIVGGTGTNRLRLHNQGVGVGLEYKVFDDKLSHPGGDLFFYEFSTLTVNAGSGGDSFFVEEVPVNTTVRFEGGSGSDKLYGPHSISTWNITNNNAGNINNKIEFGAVENLSGRTFPDRYTFSPGKHINGIIDDIGSDNDSLDYSLFSSPINVNVQDGTATSVANFGGIEFVLGSGHVLDLITGPNADRIYWKMAGVHGGNIEWNSGGNPRAMGFTGIENLLGGIGDNWLTGGNIANTWNLIGPASGTLNTTLSFGEMDRVIGGNKIDHFFPLDGVDFGFIDGSGQSDMLSYFDWVSPVTVDMNRVSRIETIFGGSSLSDVLLAKDINNNWDIMDNTSGIYSGKLNTTGFDLFETIVGGSQSDRFKFYHGSFIAATIVGGDGTDTLDYSQYGTYSSDDVTVNLTTLVATGTQGILGIENVTGGIGNDTLTGDMNNNILRGGDGTDTLEGEGGNDILLGDAGQDKLGGGTGRDLLIGGANGDSLFGGSEDDLLIASSTVYDTQDVKLKQILEVWTRTGVGNSYSQRIAGLSTGAASKKYPVKLTPLTVIDDHAIDELFGQGELDWFWGRASEVKDLTGVEQRSES